MNPTSPEPCFSFVSLRQTFPIREDYKCMKCWNMFEGFLRTKKFCLFKFCCDSLEGSVKNKKTHKAFRRIAVICVSYDFKSISSFHLEYCCLIWLNQMIFSGISRSMRGFVFMGFEICVWHEYQTRKNVIKSSPIWKSSMLRINDSYLIQYSSI